MRHELLMGLALGVTLGVIGFARASLTPEDVRGDTKEQEEMFQVWVHRESTLPSTPPGGYRGGAGKVSAFHARQAEGSR